MLLPDPEQYLFTTVVTTPYQTSFYTSRLAPTTCDPVLRSSILPQYRSYTRTPIPTTTSIPPVIAAAPASAKDETVCIGQISASALILSHISYICSQSDQPTPYSSTLITTDGYVPVRMEFDHATKRLIHISVPTYGVSPAAAGDSHLTQIGGEEFGAVEQTVANVLGPLMNQDLIRPEAQMLRALPSFAPILPLRILLFTSRGNAKVVASFLTSGSILLEHPSLPYVPSEHQGNPPYENPHHSGMKLIDLRYPVVGAQMTRGINQIVRQKRHHSSRPYGTEG